MGLFLQRFPVISRTSIELLISELENDFDYITQNVKLYEKALARVQSSFWNDELDLMVLGSCLHALYNAFEAYFFRIAKFFENSIDKSMWYRDLLDRMALEIRGVRPALISDRELFEKIDELRRFRHLFRNLYKTKLHPEKLKIVSDAAQNIDAVFAVMHTNFVGWLRALTQALE
jgi:hypothetical protein